MSPFQAFRRPVPALGPALAAVAVVFQLTPAGAGMLMAQAARSPLRIEVPGTGFALELAFLPGSTFTMGSPPDEAARDPDEGPVHEVMVDAFWMTTHEITQRQYRPFRLEQFDSDASAQGAGSFEVDAVTRPSPPYEDPTHGLGGEGHPMTGLTRFNALHYARWLSEKTGRLFRLPTEAEWEYACRLGTPPDPGRPVADGAVAGLLPAVEGEPDRMGMRHLLGNAAEWVLDGYVADAYGRRATSGPATRPVEGDPVRGRGLVRGGSFDDPPEERRCGARMPEDAAWKRRDPQIPRSRWWNTDSPHVGFRLVSPAEEHTPDEIRAYFDTLLAG